MLQIGDQVVHRAHGAGIVKGIEEKVIDGETMQLARINLTLKEADILVPLKNGASLDIRIAITEDGIKEIEEILSGKKEVIPEDAKDALTPQDLIASNDPRQIAQAVRILTDETRGEEPDLELKEILSTARMKLAGEIMLAKTISKAGALSLINRSIHGTEKFLKAAEKRRKKTAKKKING